MQTKFVTVVPTFIESLSFPSNKCKS